MILYKNDCNISSEPHTIPTHYTLIKLLCFTGAKILFHVNAEYKDYSLINDTLTLTIGQTVGDKQCSQLLILDDDFVESNETILFSINAVSNVNISFMPKNISFTILEDPTDSKFAVYNMIIFSVYTLDSISLSYCVQG